MPQTSKNEGLEEAEWVPAYEQAKQADKKDAWEVCLNDEQECRLHIMTVLPYT